MCESGKSSLVRGELTKCAAARRQAGARVLHPLLRGPGVGRRYRQRPARIARQEGTVGNGAIVVLCVRPWDVSASPVRWRAVLGGRSRAKQEPRRSCGAGTYQPLTGQSACVQLLKSVQGSMGSTICLSAPPVRTRHWLAVPRALRAKAVRLRAAPDRAPAHLALREAAGKASSCESCGHTTWSRVGAITCSLCREGYYYLDGGGGGRENGTCVLCESDGVNCGSIGETLPGLRIKPGFYRISSSAREIRVCPSPLACVGGNISGAYCREGHTGPLCSVCQKRYFFDSILEVCVACHGNTMVWRLVLVALLAFVLALAVYVWHRRTIQKSRKNQQKHLVLQKMLRNGASGRSKNKLRIMVSLAQITSSVPSNFSIEFPDAFSGFLAFLGFSNLNFGGCRWVRARLRPYMLLGMATGTSLWCSGAVVPPLFVPRARWRRKAVLFMLLNFTYLILPWCPRSRFPFTSAITFRSRHVVPGRRLRHRVRARRDRSATYVLDVYAGS